MSGIRFFGLAAVMTAGTVALAGCSSPSKAPTTSPATSAPTSAPTSSQTTSPPTSTTSRVPEDRLSSFLLTPDEGNAIMGATMQDQGGLSALDTNAFAVSKPDCLGPAHIVQPPVYADSGYTAVQFDVLHEPGMRYTHSIEQALTAFPSSDQALAFVQASAGKWKACAGQEVTETLNGGSTGWTFGNLVGDPPKISMIMNRHNARGWTCQRVLSAVRNAVIDVKACAFKISDQGMQAADKIAAKATQ